MKTIHAWFSFETALRAGSAVYRTPGGGTVNVTRRSAEKEAKGSFPPDEKYLGQVVADEEGGCIRETWRVRGISD